MANVYFYLVGSAIIMVFVVWEYRVTKRENLAERPAKYYNYKSRSK